MTAPHPDRTDPTGPESLALALLAGGVPLTLLLDLAAAVPSRELFRTELGDTRWVPSRVA